jgi:hypothetical protein
MRTIVFCLAILLTVGVSSAQDQQVQRVLTKFERFRPSERELAMYRLDWAESLDDALQRAKRERRPVVLVVIHAQYGDIHSGHC